MDDCLWYIFVGPVTGWHAICNKEGKNMSSPA